MKKIILLDASALKQSACTRKLALMLIQGYTAKVPPYKAEFGSAVHKFLDEFYSTGDIAVGTMRAMEYYSKCEVPADDFRTTSYLVTVCQAYTSQYRFDNFTILRDAEGKALVEQRFQWPFYSDDEYEVVLCGTIDAIGTINGSEYVIVDHKTTAVFKQQEYLESYLLSVQLKFYKLLLNKLCATIKTNFSVLANAGTMINGIFLGKSGTKFARSEVFYYPQEVIDEFESLLLDKVKQLLAYCKAGYFPPDGKISELCNSAYGKCPYFYGCAMPDTQSFNDWLLYNMIQKDYNPMKHGTHD